MNSKIRVKCDNCGKEFEKWPCRVNKHNFCCHSCYLTWQSRRPKELYLGKSPKCHRVKRKTPEPPITTPCQQCGKSFIKLVSAPTRFCSRQCANTWLKENSVHRKPRGHYHWKSPEKREKALKNVLKGLFKRPTSLERQFISLAHQHKLPYKYTGDGSFLIGYKNPDFVNTDGAKICIEVANHYHHQGDWAEKRVEHFKKYGWDCIVFFAKGKKLDELQMLARLGLEV